MLLRAVELVVLCGAASHSVDGVFAGVLALLRDAFRGDGVLCSRCCARAVLALCSLHRTEQLAYYKDTSKHCTEPRRGIARALSNAAKLDICI